MDTNHAIIQFVNFDTEEIRLVPELSLSTASFNLENEGYDRINSCYWSLEVEGEVICAFIFRLKFGQPYGEIEDKNRSEIGQLAKKSWGE